MQSSTLIGVWAGLSRGLVGVCVALGLAGLAAAQSPVRQASVSGLIVKLKGAAPHERVAALGDNQLRSSEATRMQHVLQMARMTEVRTRPVGRAAQHFDFGHRLSVTEAQALATQLRGQPEVEWVELNTRERLMQVGPAPNDPYYSYFNVNDTGQWWLRPAGEDNNDGWLASWGAPGMQNAWSLTTGSPAAIVAVLDTGVTNHQDLNNHYLPGYDFVSEVIYANDNNGRDADPSDPGDWVSAQDVANNPGTPSNPGPFDDCDVQNSSWHGTIMSGIVAAQTNNGQGVAGVSWDGRVLPVRVAGKCGATVEDIVDGMRWAAGLLVAGVPRNLNPASIINISFGGSDPCGPLYQDTINELTTIGVVVVAAAGNESGGLTRPASCTGVVGVVALARDGLKASYSNFGTGAVIATVGGDPGIDDGIFTVTNTGTQSPSAGDYGPVFGTSAATPIVSGVISLMLSVNPTLSVPQIIYGLQVSSRPHVLSNNRTACTPSNNAECVCTAATCGSGVLDALGAVNYAAAPTAPPPPVTDSGGGAVSWIWLVGLAMGVVALQRVKSRPGRAQRERLAP